MIAQGAVARTTRQLSDEVIENETAHAGHKDIYFYYRFQNGHPVLNTQRVDGKNKRVDGKNGKNREGEKRLTAGG